MLKRIILVPICLLVFLSGSAALSAQSAQPAAPIVITAPAGGSVWQIGTKQIISWNYDEKLTGKSFKVILRNQNSWSTLLTYYKGTNGKAAWEWKVGDYVDVNDTWYIVVESFDGRYKAISPPFKAGEKLGVVALAPSAGEKLVLGSTTNISWLCKGGINSVRILLLQDSTSRVLAANLAAKADNTGVFAWNIPKNLSLHNKYLIRVQSETDPAVHSDIPVAFVRP